MCTADTMGNKPIQFGNESLTYDANGNRTSDGKFR